MRAKCVEDERVARGVAGSKFAFGSADVKTMKDELTAAKHALVKEKRIIEARLAELEQVDGTVGVIGDLDGCITYKGVETDVVVKKKAVKRVKW
jgi:hypothetical protein